MVNGFRSWVAPLGLAVAIAGCEADEASNNASDDGLESGLGTEGSGSGTPTDDTDQLLHVVVEVDYITGAEPSVQWSDNSDAFLLTQTNLEAAFSMTTATVEVPMSLAEMESLDIELGDSITQSEIFEIADMHRGTFDTLSQSAFYVLFVDAYYEDADGVQESVLGVSFGSTGIVAMFKPVIGNGRLATFVEQTTLVHELGHAIGLVNNGITMQTNHQDVEHGHHCSNDQCIMYWLNEGPIDLIEFARKYAQTSSTLLFDDDCLEDLYAAYTN